MIILVPTMECEVPVYHTPSIKTLKELTSVCLRTHMENRGSKRLFMSDSAPIFFNNFSITITQTADLAGWDPAWQPHPSLLLLREAHGDRCRMTGAVELPALSIGLSSQLHPLRALKGNFLGLIAERWMPGMRS